MKIPVAERYLSHVAELLTWIVWGAGKNTRIGGLVDRHY